MTKFLYEMQDELFNLNMMLPVGEFSTIKKLIDHIENQGKQLRELNKAIAKKNETIAKCETEMNNQRRQINNLFEKVRELNGKLNDGIRDSEDLSWKEKYNLAIKEKECTVNALQNKCKSLEYQIATKDIAIESVERARDCLREKIKKLERANLDQGDTIGWYVEDFKKLKEENEVLERNYAEEVKIKEQFKTTCFRHETTIANQKATIEDLKEKAAKYIHMNTALSGKLVSIAGLVNEISDALTSNKE